MMWVSWVYNSLLWLFVIVMTNSASTHNYVSTLKKDIDRNLAYKREVARLRAEDQQEFRENEAQIQEMRRYQILEKHLNMQQKLECK